MVDPNHTKTQNLRLRFCLGFHSQSSVANNPKKHLDPIYACRCRYSVPISSQIHLGFENGNYSRQHLGCGREGQSYNCTENGNPRQFGGENMSPPGP